MYVSKDLSTNESGHLAIGGVDTVELAQQYGTPLCVFDEDLIRSHCEQFKSSIDRYYHGAGLVCYASKAFCCKEMLRIVNDENCGADIVSIGELYTAMSVDFPAEKICYHGNNKTAEELNLALDYGVGRIVVDNLNELNLLNELAAAKGKTATVLLRITPGIDAHTHSFIQTGQIDSKFGMTIEFGAAMEGVKTALALLNINLDGVHCHIGSQIFDIDPFEHAAEVMLNFIADIKKECGYEINTMNLGGGFGIMYVPSDDPVEYDLYMKRVSDVVKAKAEELNVKLPFIIIEPGRSIVAPAGITLYTVGGVKEIPGVRKYVSIDGGMTDNIRYALYESEYDFVIANKAGEPKDDVVTVAGRCCESGDLLGKDLPLQKAEVGDTLAVCATGAYNYSMANHYNRVRKPAVVMVKGGESRVVIRRETLEDIISCDI
jgi:diaminopimelate decarboxylase